MTGIKSNCHNSANFPRTRNIGELRNENERDVSFPDCSTSIQMEAQNVSTNFVTQNSPTENNPPNELPLIDGIQSLHSDGRQQRLFTCEQNENCIDDEAEPPTCYSELFEKPLSPSTSNNTEK